MKIKNYKDLSEAEIESLKYIFKHKFPVSGIAFETITKTFYNKMFYIDRIGNIRDKTHNVIGILLNQKEDILMKCNYKK